MKNFLYLILLLVGSIIFPNEILATHYYSKSSGAITTLSTWGTNVNGTGTAPTSFSGSADIWSFANRASFTLSSPFTTNVNATVIIEAGVNVIASGVAPGLRIISLLDIASTGSLTISRADVGYKFNNLDPNSNVVFNHASAFIRPAYYGNVIVATSTKLDVPSGGDIGILGTLTINSSQVLTMNSNGMLLYGGTVIAGAGTITGDNTGSSIAFYGGNGGNSGTLNFTSGSAKLTGLFLFAPDVNSFLVLGNNLSIENSGVFWQSTGGFKLNGKTLTVDATSDASFANDNASGGIMGDASSSMILKGTIGASSGLPDLYMDATLNTLKVLSINSTSSLNFGNAINITDSLDVTDATITTSGFLTLKSTNALKGRVSEIKGAGSVSGNINVEAFIAGGFAGWMNMGPAGVSGLTVSNWDGGSGSATGIAMTCNGCINNEYSAGGSYFVSIQSDPTGTGSYTDLVASDPLNPGQGYWIYVGSSLTSAIDITQTNTGPIVTGNLTSASSFVSNPYPSPISADRLKVTNPTMGAVYVYDPETGTTVSYNSGVGGLANGAIAMGQAFYIDGSSIDFQESHKVSRNTSANPLMKNTNTTNVGTVFQLQINGTNSDVDRTYVRMHQSATNSYDASLDAYKKFVTPGYVGYPGPYTAYTTISSKLNNVDYSINSVPLATTNNLVLPILVKVMSSGSYTISPIDISNLPPNACVILKDKLLNVNHDLRTGAYVCNINDSTSVPRFELTICSDITTGVNDYTSSEFDNTIISQDANGAFVKTNFITNTKAIISAYNLMGQKIMSDKEIEGTELTTRLDLSTHNQVVIIRVTSATQNTTKKIFVN